MKSILKILLSLSKTIAIFCLWFLLTTLITISLSKLEKEHYTPTDTPNERFMVNGQRWQDFLDNPQELQIKPTPIDECMDGCLKILENGNYQYINEGALQTEYSEYQIDGDTVIPVSFEQYNFGHFVVAMFLAFLIISFLKYLHAIYQIRKNKTDLIIYHKKLAKELLIFWVIVGIGWGLIWFGRG